MSSDLETWIAVISALVAIVAAIVTWILAKRALTHAAYSELVGEYNEYEMSVALQALKAWRKQVEDEGHDFGSAIRDWEKDFAGGSPSEESQERDKQRRLVRGFFDKAAAYIDLKLLGRKFAKDIKGYPGKSIMRYVAIPMSRERASRIGTKKDGHELETRFMRVFYPGETLD